MEVRKEKLKAIINQYKAIRETKGVENNISEETIRTWINKFLEVFGWDTGNPSYIIQEKILTKKQKEKLKSIDSTNTKPDYQLRDGRKTITFLEAKDITVNIKEDKKAAFQIKSYGWSISAPCVFLMNFDELAIYDTTYIPKKDDNLINGRIYLTIDEYLNNFDILDKHFYRENVLMGSLLELYENEDKEGKYQKKITPDVAFANELSKFRLSLANNIFFNNKKFINNNIEILSYITQIIINRIIFIRICEAREIEQEGLLKEFQKNGFWQSFKKSSYYEFYNHYDGPLFERIQCIHNLNIDNEVFNELLLLLYYPSPYKFDVIPTKLLSDIYELFLVKRLDFDGEKVIEKLKPEYTKTNGAISTPQYLVQDLLKRTISEKKLISNGINEILEKSFLDFACGSGAFLVELFDYLHNIIIQCYKNNPLEEYKKLFFQENDNLTLNVEGKRLLVSKCLYGIDIDPEAVEVARMSLSFKIIDDLEFFTDYNKLGVHGEKILHEVGKNIKCGNTLVSSDIIKKYPDLKKKENREQLFNINMFDWKSKKGFKEVFEQKKGFDYIVGNPPYVEAKHYKSYYPLMHLYITKTYFTFSHGKVDLSIPFIERAISLLNQDGRLGVIMQNRFFTTNYGKNIREYISSKKLLFEVVNFKSTSLFKGRITYISLMIFDKSKHPTFCYTTVNEEASKVPYVLKNLPSSEDNKERFVCMPINQLTKDSWTFESLELLNIKESLSKRNCKFGNFASVKVGIQVLWTKGYHIEAKEIDWNRGVIRGKTGIDDDFEIEIKACRALVPNERLYCLKKEEFLKFAIFPYDIIDGQKKPILFDDFCSRYPLAGDYLKKHKSKFEEKIKELNPDPQKWHLYTRENNLEKNYPKVIIPMTANDIYASVTQNEFYYCDNSNVNYVDLPQKTEENLYAVAGIFNSIIFSVLARAIANKQEGGYFKFNKQYIEPVLFPSHIFNDNKLLLKEIALIAKEIEKVQNEYICASPKQRRILYEILENLWTALDDAVFKAYEVTEEQKKYFLSEGRNKNRIEVLSPIC